MARRKRFHRELQVLVVATDDHVDIEKLLQPLSRPSSKEVGVLGKHDTVFAEGFAGKVPFRKCRRMTLIAYEKECPEGTLGAKRFIRC